MIKITCKLTGHELSLVNAPIVSSDSVEFDAVKFQFDTNWTGFHKVAVFWGSDADIAYGSLVDDNDEAVIPTAILEEKATIRFGVFGEDPDGLLPRITSTILKYKIKEGAWSESFYGDDEATQSLVDQLRVLAFAISEETHQFVKDSTEAYETFTENSTEAYEAFTQGCTDIVEAAKDYVLDAMEAKVEEDMPGIITGWLNDHVNPESDVVIDDTLSISGAAADAAACGVLKSALNKSYELDEEGKRDLYWLSMWVNADTWNNGTIDTSVKYRVSTSSSIKLTRAIKISVASGFEAKYFYLTNSSVTSYTGWKSEDHDIPANQEFRICIRRATESTSERANIFEFVTALTYQSKTDSDVTELSSTVSGIGTQVTKINNKLNMGDVISPTFEANYYIKSSTGEKTSDSTYSCTDYLEVTPGMLYNIYARCFNDASGCAFYDKDNIYIKGYSLYVSGQLANVVVPAPANAKYIRYTCRKGDSGSSTIEMVNASGSIGNVMNQIPKKDVYWNAVVQPLYFLVHIDCARKYISVANMKSLIDATASAGANQIQIHFSEDSGFRLELENMTVSANGTTYNIAPCLGGDENGSKWYSEADMDSIISYARSKNVDVVPSFDMPGHMGRILSQFTMFKYDGSNTLDITNASAVNFGLALLEKYAKYFVSRGCQFYNIGYDEIVGATGFETFYDNNQYNIVADFANKMIDLVESLGMTPRIFNEVVYYEKDYNYYISKKAEVYSWYSPDPCAKPTDLQLMGYKLINTRHSWYWVLGRPSMQVTAETLRSANILRGYHGGYPPHNGYGGMFCIWCDLASTEPDAGDDGANLVTQVTPLIAAWGVAISNAKAVQV